jgi:hypothetical protein
MIAQSVAKIVKLHVKLTVEGIVRMYLNVFAPGLQYEQGIIRFFRHHRGQAAAAVGGPGEPDDQEFCGGAGRLCGRHEVPLVRFEKGQRKDTVMAEHLRRFAHEEGVMFIGKAQENTAVFPTERRAGVRKTGRPYPLIVRRSAMVITITSMRSTGTSDRSSSSSAATLRSMPSCA